MEEAIDWLGANLVNLKRPFLGYFHFYPPHAPYNPRAEFINRFDNGWVPAAKPSTPFSGEYAQGFLNRARLQYDEYVAYVDAEFGRLYDTLESQGVLDETVVIVTSDHGELFERGVWQHTTEMLYEPVIRIPMIVTEPGQDWRRDVRQPTSAVDVLPTLCEQTGCPVPAWCEGQVLPAFDRDAAESRRAVYAVDAKSASRRGPLEQGTIALWEGPYKLIHYFGYVNLAKTYELYDLEQDPEERVDCFGVRSEVGSRLQNRVLDQLQRINEGNLRTHHSMDESWSEGRIDHA
jgi:arylsulfatase A-like enzyme